MNGYPVPHARRCQYDEKVTRRSRTSQRIDVAEVSRLLHQATDALEKSRYNARLLIVLCCSPRTHDSHGQHYVLEMATHRPIRIAVRDALSCSAQRRAP